MNSILFKKKINSCNWFLKLSGNWIDNTDLDLDVVRFLRHKTISEIKNYMN